MIREKLNLCIRGGWQRSESELQIEVMKCSYLMASDHPSVMLLHSIPNGDWRGYKTAKKLNAEGLKSGFPDLGLPVARGGYHGLYIELKRASEKPSPEQWSVMEALDAEGSLVRVCNDLPTTVGLLLSYLRGEILIEDEFQ